METRVFFENTTSVGLSESWSRTCTVMVDRPLSAAYWNLEEMSGEKFLEELPPLQTSPEQIYRSRN